MKKKRKGIDQLGTQCAPCYPGKIYCFEEGEEAVKKKLGARYVPCFLGMIQFREGDKRKKVEHVRESCAEVGLRCCDHLLNPKTPPPD